jgi:hypothetical protein
MSDAALGACADDSASLKWNALPYMLKNPTVDVLTPPIVKTQSGSKVDRGFNHPTIAALLCPRHLLEDYTSNEQ